MFRGVGGARGEGNGGKCPEGYFKSFLDKRYCRFISDFALIM